jgi:hypothetical protein
MGESPWGKYVYRVRKPFRVAAFALLWFLTIGRLHVPEAIATVLHQQSAEANCVIYWVTPEGDIYDGGCGYQCEPGFWHYYYCSTWFPSPDCFIHPGVACQW